MLTAEQIESTKHRIIALLLLLTGLLFPADPTQALGSTAEETVSPDT